MSAMRAMVNAKHLCMSSSSNDIYTQSSYDWGWWERLDKLSKWPEIANGVCGKYKACMSSSSNEIYTQSSYDSAWFKRSDKLAIWPEITHGVRGKYRYISTGLMNKFTSFAQNVWLLYNFRKQDSGLETSDSGLGTRGSGLWTRDSGFGTASYCKLLKPNLLLQYLYS